MLMLRPKEDDVVESLLGQDRAAFLPAKCWQLQSQLSKKCLDRRFVCYVQCSSFTLGVVEEQSATV